ncbi:unnamed protein product [Microthlaspi erraticum]|uniref:Arabidopsis retrotransposon Orf1 C-terminal domain-containing protein n=1 Tax=Microthlaspi erraticum TaxID=1685480 RepID=A0A6D2JCW8_9BRAS|nr:unnamed protein product [Microthlaspi erraticum]
MYQEHYNALFSMDFVETKYPHDDTMKALGIFEMWSWSQEHALGQVLLLPHGVYKELTCEFSFNEVQGCSDQEPSVEICAQGLPTPSLQGRHGTINEGEVKLLDMGIKPIISRTRMARGSGEIDHRELMPP